MQKIAISFSSPVVSLHNPIVLADNFVAISSSKTFDFTVSQFNSL